MATASDNPYDNPYAPPDPPPTIAPPTPAKPYQDIAYWQGKGYGTNDMFDANGQMKPGWSRSANGYDFDPSAVTAPAGPSGGAPPPTNTGPRITDPFNEPFVPPNPVNLGGPAGIGYIPPTPTFGNAPISYTPTQFKPPSIQDILNNKSYQFRTEQGSDQLQKWAGAKGTLNDSSTAKALEDYGQNAASAEYQNVWNRDYGLWNQENANGFAAANGAAGNFQNFVVNPAMTGYSTQASAGQHANDTNFTNAWNKYLFDWGAFTDNRDSTWNKQFQYANT